VSGPIDASKLLRPGLLEGVSVLVAGASSAPLEGAGSLAQAVSSACAGLGARVSAWQPDELPAADTDMLVLDCASLLAHAGELGETDAERARQALSGCLEDAWEATRAVANAAFIDPGRPGRIVYLAPPRNAGGFEGDRHAEAARAGLENLSRTLSIEWSRYEITAVTVAPAAQRTDEQVAALVAFLGSPAGAYFSGCLFDLRGPGGDSPG
jgi:NAD(P)-dependent dehydrogenase (short-subunit alcohol dehydrogenase family)